MELIKGIDLQHIEGEYILFREEENCIDLNKITFLNATAAEMINYFSHTSFTHNDVIEYMILTYHLSYNIALSDSLIFIRMLKKELLIIE